MILLTEYTSPAPNNAPAKPKAKCDITGITKPDLMKDLSIIPENK